MARACGIREPENIQSIWVIFFVVGDWKEVIDSNVPPEYQALWICKY